MKKLMELTPTVKKVLEEHPETRSNNDFLFVYVLMEYSSVGVLPFASMRLNEYFARASEFGTPNYESITRIRRKVQREHPELAPNKEMAEVRTEAEQGYKAYNRSEV